MINKLENMKIVIYTRTNGSTIRYSQILNSLLTNFLIEYKKDSFNGKRNSYKRRIEEYLSKSNK